MPDAIALAETLRREIRRTDGALRFADFLAERPGIDDETLAELIEADGRARLAMGAAATLNDYLRDIPDLPDRPDALDAAIDVALRARAGASKAPPEVVAALIREHPDLEPEIRDAAAINNAFWSTRTMRDRVVRHERREVPCDFGAAMPDGRLRYELRRSLGAGAFGEVFLALDRQLSDAQSEALVAIKVLATRDRSLAARRRLVEEAIKARRIDHPNIVRVLDRGVSDRDEDYLVHEFVEGGALAERFDPRREPVDPHVAARIVRDIARGMQTVHNASLIHCDLKPGNILLTKDGDPKVGDFGVAIRSGESPDEFADDDRSPGNAAPKPAAHPLGNLAFMSPEQHRMEDGALTAQSDIYALGGILYWLLTGALPNGESPDEVARTHDPALGRREAPSPRALRPAVDRDLDALCRRALAPDPADRYTAAAMLADDLDAWLRREPIRWTRPTPLRVGSLWLRRQPVLAAIIAGAMIAVTVGAAVAWRSAALARQREVEARIAEVKLEEEVHWRTQTALVTRAMSAQMRRALRSGLMTEMFPALWVFEWMFGPQLLDMPEHIEEIWQTREVGVRQMIADYTALGGEDSLNVLLWRTGLAHWLNLEGRHQEAEPLIADLQRRWGAILQPGDPWLGALDAMAAVAAVNRLTDAGAGDSVEARYLERQLLAWADISERVVDGAHTRYLIFRSLARLYGPGVLDRPEAAQRMLEAAAELGVSDATSQRAPG
ncbi:MAG: serine/threonine protein kinase [Phycisphaerales bacterium]|nr:MAG: serine/threonine protein kinase [Phycisphaerales bacterium]